MIGPEYSLKNIISDFPNLSAAAFAKTPVSPTEDMVIDAIVLQSDDPRLCAAILRKHVFHEISKFEAIRMKEYEERVRKEFQKKFAPSVG